MFDAKTMTWIMVVVVMISLLGCSDEKVVSTELPVTKRIGFKTVDSLLASMHNTMGRPNYSGSNVRNFLSNFESLLAVDGAPHVLSAPYVMTQMGLASHMCERGLSVDAGRPNNERIFLKGINWNGNLTNAQPDEEARKAYYQSLIENIWGEPATSQPVDTFERLYVDLRDGFTRKNNGEFRLTLISLCTAAMGSIQFAMTK